ncbi:MAG: polymer-forming cytoskeletal protein [Lachnospiraceae bacterium]|nr:polymer-forming cytoskeletal protein [Lachnospiraceae bacterium]
MLFKDDDTIRIKESSIRTIISADTRIDGSVTTENSIRLSGTVNGNVSTKGFLIVGNGASVTGNITAESVIVAGRVEGDLNIADKVNIESTGEVYGDIVTKRLLIDEDSIFSGKCTMKRGDGSKKDNAAIEKAEKDVKAANERARQKSGEKKEPKEGEMPVETETEAAEEEPAEISYIDMDSIDTKRGKKRKR